MEVKTIAIQAVQDKPQIEEKLPQREVTLPIGQFLSAESVRIRRSFGHHMFRLDELRTRHEKRHTLSPKRRSGSQRRKHAGLPTPLSK